MYRTQVGFDSYNQPVLVLPTADPDYLVRYYRGARDPQRTPFETRRRATPPALVPQPQVLVGGGGGGGDDGDPDLLPNWTAKVAPNNGRTYYVNQLTKQSRWIRPQASGSGAAAGGSRPPLTVWEFDDNGTWKPYDDAAQIQLEDAHRSTPPTVVTLSTGRWTYSVDVAKFVQTNVDTGTQRNVQRRNAGSTTHNPLAIANFTL